MNIYYTSFVRFPNEKAHGKQIKEVCNSMATDSDVTIVVPNRHTSVALEGFGLDPNITIVYIPTLDYVRFCNNFTGWVIASVLFTLFSGVYMLWQKLRGRQPVIITREYFCAIIPALLRIPTVWESHRGQWNQGINLVRKLGVHFFVISKGLQSLYIEKGVPEKQISLMPDGVDLRRYQNLPSREQARKQLALPAETFIAIYNGHLQSWKGVDTLAAAAKLLPDNFQVIFMGGTDEAIAEFKEKHAGNPNISIIGRRDDTQRPVYLRAANVLMLPNSAENEISVKYTSPLKLFGYMATEVSIVASNLPSIKEVLTEEEAFFAEPDDPASFASVIESVQQQATEADRRAANAHKLVVGYGWDVRAQKSLSILSKLAS